ncbi:unnamed protein product [Mytilus edulis]|uniref:TIR domain-containing protein n=1 Tax=Mytilus edulis TaxID=6550 RepID=A0A8S3QWH8_MYTED|nr:unnamed protein product [Mytilus edulis]
MGELLNNIPDNRESEFDVQIQQSIGTLQEIKTNMAYEHDVAIIYSQDDIPPKTKVEQMVDPRKIHEDLKQEGFNCWFPEKVDKTTELENAEAIMNAKVLVICMSERFTTDTKCRKIFTYATEQFHKPLAVAVLDETQEWRQTDIGFKIGNPKMAMIKNVKRYGKKIKDLIDIIKNHIHIQDIGKIGLYQAITVGLQHSKVLVVCVSDEYLKSDACMMEARFGVDNLQMPMVVCVVGTGKAWKTSEEEIELIQRKFMRRIVQITSADDLEIELPKLMVFDFVKTVSDNKTTSNDKDRDMQSQMMDGEWSSTSQLLLTRSRKMSRNIDNMKFDTSQEDDGWKVEDFCIRVICEDEQGWHLVDGPLFKIDRTSDEIYKTLKDAAPFLARIYAVLKQSSISLNCLSSKKGEKYLNFIRQEGVEYKNFSDAYKVIHNIILESEVKDDMFSPLVSCYLPSGKIGWLCKDHQRKAGITKLQIGTSRINNSLELIFEEDKLLNLQIKQEMSDPGKETNIEKKRRKNKMKVMEKMEEKY